MTPLNMARLNLQRNSLQTWLFFIALTLSLTSASVLLHLFALNDERFTQLRQPVDGILGAKSGGIEILLGALNFEKIDSETRAPIFPHTLYETLRSGADILFEDGVKINSAKLTKAVAPLLQAGQAQGFPVVGTDQNMQEFLQVPNPLPELKDHGAWGGHGVAKALGLQVGQSVDWQSDDSEVQSSQVTSILPEQGSTWDNGIFVNLQSVQEVKKSTGVLHPIWKEKVLSFVLVQFDASANGKTLSAMKSLLNDRSVGQFIFVHEEKHNLQKWTSSLQGLGMFIVMVIALLAGVAILGLWMLRVDALRVSVATLQVLGYPLDYVMKWLVSEALLVGLGAGVVAFFLDWIVMEFFARIWQSLVIPRHHDFDFYVIGGGILISLLASAWPLMRISRASIHQELKTG